MGEIHPLVAALVTAFGVGAWLSVNGVWVELPLLVSLPEGWALPSYLSIIIQIANVGPIVFSILKCTQPNTKPAPFIYFVLCIGSLASLFLIFFWDATSEVAGVTHSTALLILVFFLALVDCTSSVLYLPYMALWKSQYLPVYSSGEGLSGLIPALVASIQGAGGGGDSDNIDDFDNSTTDFLPSDFLTTESPESTANFSVSTFFLILFLLMVISFICFAILDQLPLIQGERECSKFAETNLNSASNGNFSNINDSMQIYREAGRRSPTSDSSNIVLNPAADFEWSRDSLLILLAGQLFASMLTNGFLPSIQSYSCAPYGNVAYHWAAITTAVANPVAAGTTVFLKRRVNFLVIFLLMTIGTSMAAYITVASAMSPLPPMVGTTFGSVFIVVIWGLFAYIMTFVRVEINNLLRLNDGSKGERALFWSGGCTQLGSFVGALAAFLLVNVAGVFHQ